MITSSAVSLDGNGSHIDHLLDDIKHALNNQQFEEAELLLNRAQTHFSLHHHKDANLRKYMQLQAAFVIHKASLDDTWYDAFGLHYDQCSVHDIKRQYKRLASLIHPDKSKDVLPHSADSLFQSLQQGYEKLLEDKSNAFQRYDHDSIDSFDGDAVMKKRKRKHDNHELTTDEYMDDDDDDEYAWWTEWDSVNSNKKKTSDMDNNQQETRHSEDQIKLQSLSIDELRLIIRQRQDAMLSGSSQHDGNMYIGEMKEGIERAKQLLILKLNEERKNDDNGSGGFIR